MKNKGFTLMEILIVIAVLAILIGIAVPRIKGFQDEANISKAKTELKAIQAAVESYYMNNSNVYPATLGVVTTVSPQIIATIPDDPWTKVDYTYDVGTLYYVIQSGGVAAADASMSVSEVTGAVSGKGTGEYCVTNGTGC